MECNKDEAVRAKGIAEKKLLERDIIGAKKFALKAQSLFPKLDGLSQFLEIIVVYIAHEKKINGETDYYGIFGVDQFADEEALKKQYKRKALSLHPDKNKSAGADEAFKILSQARDVLSDKNKRSSYNLKINIRASNQTGGFRSSSAMNTTNPQQVPTQPRTPAAATNSPVSGLNRENPEKRGHTGVPMYGDSAKKGSQGTARSNATATNPNGMKNQTGNFSSSNAKYAPTRPQTPGTAASQQYAYAPHHPMNTTSGTSSQHVPSRKQTPAAATVFGPPYNPATFKPVSGLNKENPVKRRRTDVHKCDSAVGNMSGVKKGSANPKVNLSSTIHAVLRNQTGSFSSSSAKCNTSSAKPQQVPTRPKTPGTATNRQSTSAPSGTSSQHVPCCRQTPAAATVVGRSCNRVSGVNRGKPVEMGHTNVHKCDSAKKAANLKGNLSSTIHALMRKHQPNHKTVKKN